MTTGALIPPITGTLDPARPFGRFSLVRKVASGGMATVFLAEVAPGDPLHGKPIALKILHEHLAEDPEFIRMFRDEGRIVRDLDHPNVVKVYEVGEHEGAYFLAMEFVDGRDLAQLLVAHRLNHQVMAPAPAFEILRQALNALRYVHGFKGKNGRLAGIVHRDVSPQNLLISRAPLVKLTDFGIARGDHRSDRTRTGTVKGKMHYMAPEQAAGHRVDARADLYALGAVAYEMLAGQPLLGAVRTEVLLRTVASGSIDYGAKFARLPADTRAWLTKALAPNPDERFHNADAMLAAMDQIQKSSRAHYKPEALLRMMDLEEAKRSKQRDPRLFYDEGHVPGSGQRHAVQPPSRESSVAAGSHVDLDAGSRSARLRNDRPDARIDWNAPADVPVRSSTGVRTAEALGAANRDSGERPRLRGASRVHQLPAETASGRSYVPARTTGVRDAADDLDLDDAGAVDKLVPHSFRRPQFAAASAQTPTAASAASSRSSAVRPAGASTRPTPAAVRQTREQQGLALAGAVSWSCGALVLFAVLLEVTGVQLQLPEVNDQTMASLFDESATATRTDAVAVSAAAAQLQAQTAAQTVAGVTAPGGLTAAETPSRAAPALRPAGDLGAAAPEIVAVKPEAPAPEAAKLPVAQARAKAERAAQRMVDAQAERAAWADKPIESVERPDAPQAKAKASAVIVPVPAARAPVARASVPVAQGAALVAKVPVPVAKAPVPAAKVGVPVARASAVKGAALGAKAPVAKAGAPVVKAKAPIAKAHAPLAKAKAQVALAKAPLVKPRAPVAKANQPVAKAKAPTARPVAPAVKAKAVVAKPPVGKAKVSEVPARANPKAVAPKPAVRKGAVATVAPAKAPHAKAPLRKAAPVAALSAAKAPAARPDAKKPASAAKAPIRAVAAPKVR